MSLLSLLAFTVYAAEMIISPLPDNAAVPSPPKPKVTFGSLLSPLPDAGQVLGITAIPTVLPTLPAPTNSPSPTPAQLHLRRNAFTIALLGDSMIDTLGPDVPDLKTQLNAFYPGTGFTLLNFGVGGTNIEYGLQRVSNSYAYLGKQFPSVIASHPDIVVVESFGYNPLPDPYNGLTNHWLDLAKIVDTLKSNLPGVKILIAATIAPNATQFGDGAAGLSFSTIDKWQHVDTIKKYLESTVKFAQGEHLPLADAFHPSLGLDGNGNLSYINAGDHIHTSSLGRIFFAKVVTQAIAANHLLE